MNAPEPRRDQGLEIAVARVGSPGGRARWAALAWAAALVGIVTLAIVQRPAEPELPLVAVAESGRHADPGPTPSPVPSPRPIVRVPVLPEDFPFVLWWPVGDLPWLTNPTQS